MADTPDSTTLPVTAAARYKQLEAIRAPYLARAREAAELTLPALMPPTTNSSVENLIIPWQSLGSRGVNHLSAKLLLALFPPGSSFFRLTLDDFVVQELAQKTGKQFEDARAEFEEALGKVERAVTNRLEQTGHRTTLFETLRQLIATGNVVLEVLPNCGIRYHKLDRFVCKRDREGNVIELIILECVSPITLPEEAKAIIKKNAKTPEELNYFDPDKSSSVDIYTHMVRTESGWKICQELMGEEIPGTKGNYPLEKSAWMVLRWAKLDGEDYGLGHVQDYIGDLKTYESLSRSIVQFAGVASKILFFTRENGITSRKKVADAPSGAVIEGDAKDVTVLQLEKSQDFGVAKAVADDIGARLEQSFLLVSGLPRDAERVTAEEIRALVNELEQALGGVYSILAQELQAPLIRRIMLQMQKEGALPSLPEKAVQAQIVTGVEALGRTSDLSRLKELVADVSEMLGGPEAVTKYINVSAYLKRVATALNFDPEGIVRSEDEVKAIESQQAQQAMTEKLGPAVLKAGTDVASAQPAAAPAAPTQ